MRVRPETREPAGRGQVPDGVRPSDPAQCQPHPVSGGAMPAQVPPGLRPQHGQDRGHVRLWPGPARGHH